MIITLIIIEKEGADEGGADVAADGADAEGVGVGAKGRGRGGRARGRGRGRGRRRLDESAEDDMKSFQAKMGKYARKSVKAVMDPRFWITMHINRKLMGRLDILQWTIQKYGAHDGAGGGHPSSSQPNNLAVLVWGKADEIYAGLCKLLDDSEWFGLAFRSNPKCEVKHEIEHDKIKFLICSSRMSSSFHLLVRKQFFVEQPSNVF